MIHNAEVNERQKQRRFKGEESDSEREGARDRVIEREATKGTAVVREHVERERRSMERWKLSNRKEATKVQKEKKNVQREQVREMRTM